MKQKILRWMLLPLLAALLLVCMPVTGASAAAAPETDSDLVSPYVADTKLIGAPTVVFDLQKSSDMTRFPDDRGRSPSNIILRLNDRGEVVGAGGQAIGDLYDVYGSLSHRVIPIVSVSSEAAADCFIGFMQSRLNVLDIAVHSTDASLVKRVREALPSVRGIVEYTEVGESLYPIVKESTEAGAMVVILPQKAADAATVSYLQARFKTVWVRAESGGYGDLCECIYGGGYGIVTNDFTAAYEALEKQEKGYTRNIFNVAHRAVPNLFNENSLGGIRAAMESGVTHLELDGHLTKDKHIVVIHDDTIDSMTNGSGTIERMTLEEIRSFELDVKQPHEKVPTFEEVLDLIKQLNAELKTDVVLVFEIKDNQKDFVENMKRILDEKQFYENIVIITFENTEHQLQALSEQVPQIPTANLDSISATNFARNLAKINTYRTGMDMSTGNYSAAYERTLIDHGFVGWFWTYSAAKDVFAAAEKGIVGVTNNSAECYGKQIRYVYGDDVKDAAEEDVPAVGAKIALKAVDYAGKISEVEGKVQYTEETAEGWRCFATFTEELPDGGSRLVYARAVNYLRPEAKSGGCGGVIGLGGGALSAVLLLGAALLSRKK